MRKYVAFLRGINVGGHHKVPMPELRSVLEKMNIKNIATILNSGNVLFETDESNTEKTNESGLEDKISQRLEAVFKFPVPTLIRSFDQISGISDENPFENINVTKDIRLYVSFLKDDVNSKISLPWASDDGSYKIIAKKDDSIFSVLDLSISKTPKAMEVLEKFYGKEITTRNWKTIERIIKKANT